MDASVDEDAGTLEAQVMSFLTRNFPQIAMHGGSAAVTDVDPAKGEVWISLGGACSGCGISPMTIQAIQSRMIKEISAVSRVHAATGFDQSPSYPERGDSSDNGSSRFPDAPF